jgi:hypothetical protein
LLRDHPVTIFQTDIGQTSDLRYNERIARRLLWCAVTKVFITVQVDEITPERIERALRAWVEGEDVPADLLALHLLSPTGSPAEQALALHAYMLTCTTETLNHLRQIEQMPSASLTRETVAGELANDFRRNTVELEAWSALYHRYLCPVSLSVKELAAHANVDPRQFRRRVQQGLRLLVERLRYAEMAAHGQACRLRLRRNLPPPDYLRLFGVEALTDRIAQMLSDPAGPGLIALDGIGGIGKTALAQAVVEQLANTETFVEVLWISARQTQLLFDGNIQTLTAPALTFDELLARLAGQLERADLLARSPEDREAAVRAILHAMPHLVVVDNLETMADFHALAPRLHQMTGPSRFLLTSRYSLREYPFVYALSVPPLSRADSLSLLHYELERGGRRRNDTLDDALDAIYEVVGGLPLALRLVAAQLNHLPLAYILDGLQSASSQAGTSLYTFIYRGAWMLLDEPARQLLTSMLLVSPNGEDAEWLRMTSGLASDFFEKALAQLIDYSLIQIAGSLDQPFYHLHPLTLTFLQTDIMGRWEGPA